MIKAALFWMGLGAALGVMMYLGYRVPLLRWTLTLRSVHVHMMLMGGVMQMIVGVALWMFPRRKDAPHWPTPSQGWSVFTLLNLGALIRSVCGGLPQTSAAFWGGLVGIALQMCGMLLFFALIYHRIRGPGPSQTLE